MHPMVIRSYALLAVVASVAANSAHVGEDGVGNLVLSSRPGRELTRLVLARLGSARRFVQLRPPRSMPHSIRLRISLSSSQFIVASAQTPTYTLPPVLARPPLPAPRLRLAYPRRVEGVGLSRAGQLNGAGRLTVVSFRLALISHARTCQPRRERHGQWHQPYRAGHERR